MPRTFGTAAFLVVLAVLFFGSAQAEERTQTFRNERGQVTGQATTRGNTTTFSNEKGQQTGRADRRPDGSTNYYDERGRMIGSSRGR